MDELQKLYEVLKQQQLYTKSFKDFQSKYSNNTENQGFLFDVVSKQQLFTKSKKEFLGKYFPKQEGVKKKDDTTEISEDTGSVGLPPKTDSPSSASPSNQKNNNQPVFTGAPTVENRDRIIKEFEESQNGFLQTPPITVNTDDWKKENLELLDQFENISLDDNELAEIDERMSKEKEGNFGFLGNIVKAITSTPTMGTFANPLFNPATVLPKDREQLVKEKLNEKRAEFIKSIGEEKQESLKAIVKSKSFKLDSEREQLEEKIETIDNSLYSIRDEVQGLDAEISSITNQREAIEKKVGTNNVTREDQVKYQNLINKQKELFSKRNQIIEGSEKIFSERETTLNNLENNLENLGTMDQEIDLLKRNYGFFDNITGRAGIGFADLGANFKYQYDRQKLRSERKNIKQLLQTKKTLQDKGLNADYINEYLPPQYLVNTYEFDEGEFDAETEKMFDSMLASTFIGKRILDEQRDKLRPNISVQDINSFGDVIDFTVDGLADNTATIAQLAVPYIGQGMFLVNQQAGNEIDLKQEKDQKETRLEEIQKIYDGESGSLVNFNDLSEEEKAKLSIEKERLEKSIDNLSDTDIFVASTGMAVSELAFSRLFGEAKRIKVGKRILNNAGKNELKREVNRATTEMFKERLKSLTKGTGSVLKDAAEEGFLDEFLTNFTQNGIRKYYLEDDSVGLFDNSIDAIAGGLSVGSVLSASPRIGGQFLSHISDRKRRNTVYNNVKEITELQNEIRTNDDLDQDVVDMMSNKINQLILENKKIVNRTVGEFDNLNQADKELMMKISNELVGLEISYDKLNKKKNPSTSEKKLKGEIEQRMNFLNEEKSNILSTNNFQSTVTDQTRDFASSFGDQEDISQYVNGATKVSIGNTEVIFGEKDGVINIESIVTPKDLRGQGSARNAMEQITKVADEKGKDLRLNVVPLDETTDANGLADFYESVGFVKDKDFDKEDGGIMRRSPQTEDSFSGIDSAINNTENTEANNDNTETQSLNKEGKINEGENVFATNQNEYSVNVVDGKLEITPLIGKTNPSQSEIKNVTKQYIEKTNFDKGDRANFEGKGNLNAEQISRVIAEESNNPQEVAQQILTVKDSNSDNNEQLSVSKEDAIAEALKSSRVNDTKKDITDLSKGYILGKNKQSKTIDQIREIAEETYGYEVEYQDVLNFLETYSSASDYIQKSRNTDEFSQTSDLEIKFKELTGLEPTAENIKSVAGEFNPQQQKNSDINDSEQDDDVPFQTESKQTKIEGAQLRSLVDRLEKTGLAEKVVVLSDQQINSKLKDIGVENVQNQQEASDKGVTITPNGFVYDRVVYLNRDKVKLDTPIHEFGHLWNSYAKRNHEAIYDKGLEIIEDTDYFRDVQNNKAYSHLSKEQQLEEALAQAIGEKGVKILNESKKNQFSAWFKRLFTRIAKGLGITSLSGTELSSITLDKFTDLVSAELLSGQPIVKNEQSKTKKDTSEITNIEVVIAEARAASYTRSVLRNQIENKKAIDKAVKNELVKFIREQLDSKRFDALNKGEFSKILTAVKNTTTKSALLNQLDKMSDLLDRLDSEIINNNIDKILNRKLTKVESGRRKANLLTEEESTILETVRNNIKGLESTSKPSEQKRAAITGKLAELFERRDEIQRNPDPSREEILEEEAINITADILMGYRSDLNSNTKAFLLNGLEQIESIYNQGRSQLIAAKEARDQEYKEFRDDLVEDANPENLVQEKRKEQIEKDRKTITADFARAYFNITKRKLIGSMDRLATVLSRKGADNRNDSAWVQFTNSLKRQETIKERRIGRMSKSITDAQKRIFGSRFNADKTLNSKSTIEIILPDPTLEEGQTPITTNTEFTNDELLSVWLNAKNEDNLSGLEANGFTQEVIDKIDQILPDNVKEYGNWQVEQFYENSWQEENEVYKRMNFHSLPKIENYAGKVYRDNIDLKEDTEALNKGKGTLRTTAHGSQKLRTKNAKPIQAVRTTFLMKKHISDTSHYVAFAEVHQKLNKLINDKKIVDAINITNPLTGDLAVKFLRFYKEAVIEKGLHRGYPIVNSIAKNINKATLALKTKIGLTQTISMVNAAVDMPSGLSPTQFIGYYSDFKRIIETYKHIVNNSEYIKRRYGKEGFDQAITGLSELLQTPMFSTGNPTLDARRKQVARFYKEGLDHAMINVKFGDKVGVMGAIPVYNAYLDRYRRNNTEEVAREKAMKQFEDAVDRSQQTISSFGKSELQNDPIGRYFAMFATAPIQNQQNAMYHFNELRRGIKGKGMKGSYLKNIYGFLNYQFAQPMLYTYISTIMASSISAALGFGDEEPDDTDKKLLSAAILGNTNSIPFIGGAMQGTVEKFILDMDKSYGEVVNSALLSNSSEFMQKFYDIADAKSKEKQVEKTEDMIKEVAALLVGMPTIVSETYFDWDDIYWNDDVSNWVKFYKALGYSDYTILQSRRDRASRTKANQKKEAEKRKWENSIKKWEQQQKQKKTEPLFKLLSNDKSRK